MQADFIKAFTSQASASSQRPTKNTFQESSQVKSRSFARELSQATRKEEAPKEADLKETDPKEMSQSSESEKAVKDQHQGKKKTEAYRKDDSIRSQIEERTSDGNDPTPEGGKQDLQVQVISLLQLLGIDPQQVDGSLLEKLGALLNGSAGSGTAMQGNELVNLLNQLTQMINGKGAMTIDLDSNQIQDIKAVLEEMVKGLAASGTEIQPAATDETMRQLKQLLSALAEELQGVQGKNSDTKVKFLQQPEPSSDTKQQGVNENKGPLSQSFQVIADNRHHTGARTTMKFSGENQNLTEQKPVRVQQQTQEPQQNNTAVQLENRNENAEKLPNQFAKGKDFGLHITENNPQVNSRQDMVSNLQRFTEAVQTATQEMTSMPKTSQAIFSQIVQKAKLINLPELAEMKIQLKPDFLGKLHLNVSVENGLVTAKFNAESHQVKAIIEANLNTLRDALSEQGVKVDQLVVNVGTGADYSGFQEQSHGQYQNLGRKNSGGITVSDEYEAGLAAQVLTSAMSDIYGSKVNFTA